jgi:tetratricopeptide (TPR) repeat protein
MATRRPCVQRARFVDAVRILAAVIVATVATTATAVDIDALWEYDDPVQSAARFRAALAGASPDGRLELQTQIARTYGLRGQFAEANQVLDRVAAALDGASAKVRVRYLLERGRNLNSSGAPAQARPLFVEAWQRANAARADGLAVDAAHMIAITLGASETAVEWNRKGLDLARRSTDPKAKALVPAMLNNMAWDLHDRGRYLEALPFFEQALNEWTARGGPREIHIARWSVARCLRSLGRLSDALTLQLGLEQEANRAGTPDGYVFEEIAELYEAMGRHALAKPYFARALSILATDPGLMKNEPERLARLRDKAR